MMAPKTSRQKPEYEFLGPYLGPIGIILGLPFVCYMLVFACNAQGCLRLTPHFNLPGFLPTQKFFTWEATAVAFGWFFFQVALHIILPGQKAQGTLLSNGKRLDYKLNGLNSFFISSALALYVGFWAPPASLWGLSLSWAYHNYVPLMTASILLSSMLSLYLYISSFLKNGALLAAGGATGTPIYDFFIGRELNPRIGSFDLKEFCELYPGLIGWVVLDLAMAAEQYNRTGSVSAAMTLVCVFQALYVWDALYNEKAILTTMDITTDGLGFMLAFGDLSWVPFTYSLQARVLVDFPQQLSVLGIIGIILLKALGYLMFRGANSQKDIFRRDPNHPKVRNLKTLPTARGTKLIISGWWGIARHVNYFGDWVMGWAWCLPTGFHSIIPYFYVAYFGALLVHRDLRDEHACRDKYGKDWDKYCEHVKYRIVPLVY
jgi:Delta14-sterol reductase